MSKAPEICRYCDGEGNGSAGGSCGFCVGGKPSDTQEDWDNSWGQAMQLILLDLMQESLEDETQDV